MGIIASDLSQGWKSPVLHLANRGVMIGLCACLVTLFYLYNFQGSAARTLNNHYDFKELLGAVDGKVGKDDLLVIDGINNVHYYIDRFQKRSYLNLYNFLKKYKVLGDKETGKKAEKVTDEKIDPKDDPWFNLSATFQQAWDHHHTVWVLNEVTSNFDGGRQLMEETLGLPDDQLKAFFSQYKLKPLVYHNHVYLYEILKPAASSVAPAVGTSTTKAKSKEKK
jgi:hypothetical protein